MKKLAIVALALLTAACSGRLPPAPQGSADADAPMATSIAIASAPAPKLAPRLFTPSSTEAEARAHSAMVIDVASGRILMEEDSRELRYPASLTKMMTLYLLFEEVAAGGLTLDSPLSVSEHAASRPPSKLGVKAGTTIRVEDAARALAVKSANDVAVVIAEALGGSEERFAALMTRTARSLGMTQTVFVNASGLPDERQVSTARDIAILARALKVRHRRFAPYFSAKEFRYDGRTFRSTNRLLGKVAGVDGLKTGYIRLSGYNLAASARRGGRSIIVVVMGGKTRRERDAEVTQLVERYL